MRLIDADELKFDSLIDSICQGQAEDVVAEAPTIEAEPVRRGRWLMPYVEIWQGGLWLSNPYCSECGEFATAYFNYCPNCGSKMEEEE